MKKRRCAHFRYLVRVLKKYTKDVREYPHSDNRWAQGTINGYKFRLFQEVDVERSTKKRRKYYAFICIRDEIAKDGMWRALYTEPQLIEWMKTHPDGSSLIKAPPITK